MIRFLGAFVLVSAREAVDRHRTITDVAADRDQLETRAETATVRGHVTVSEPAEPDRAPPAEADTGDEPPALWAWRIRRKERRSGRRGRTRWRTIEGRVAAAEFTIEDSWDEVAIVPISYYD